MRSGSGPRHVRTKIRWSGDSPILKCGTAYGWATPQHLADAVCLLSEYWCSMAFENGQTRDTADPIRRSAAGEIVSQTHKRSDGCLHAATPTRSRQLEGARKIASECPVIQRSPRLQPWVKHSLPHPIPLPVPRARSVTFRARGLGLGHAHLGNSLGAASHCARNVSEGIAVACRRPSLRLTLRVRWAASATPD
jgi:hypothetical protein